MPSRTGRRQFLTATAAGVGLLAGCTEEDSQPTDSGNSESFEDRMPDNSPATVEDNEFSVESSPSSSDRNSAEQRQLLEDYNDGIKAANDGLEARERAVGAWNNENYASTERYHEDAEEAYREARGSFRDALDTAYGLDNRDARDACETAVEYCTLRRDAAREGQLSARAAQRGDSESANSHIEETRSLEREAGRLNVLDTETVERILERD